MRSSLRLAPPATLAVVVVIIQGIVMAFGCNDGWLFALGLAPVARPFGVRSAWSVDPPRRHPQGRTPKMGLLLPGTAGPRHRGAAVGLSAVAAASSMAEKKRGKVPLTFLSGFLGSGKTSALKHLLENTEGVKIGVIVNDVASVNIDAKLVSRTLNGVMELRNGCACCSLADELLTSVHLILEKRNDLEALVVELSGVSDPAAIKSNWKLAQLEGHPATHKTDIANVVTLVDACTFGTDWMTYDLVGERSDWVDEGGDCTGRVKVTELLVEQVESADLILINKKDLAGSERVKIASGVARGINEKAVLREVEHGRVSPKQILGSLIGPGDEDGTKKEVSAEGESSSFSSSNHEHEHAHNHHASEDPPDRTDASHDHSHSHDHSCAEPDCTDASHSHSHDHQDDSDADACTDPDCTDTSHSHSHSHHATSTDQLGIVNFIYKRARPFNVDRLMAVLNRWPVPIKEDLDLEMLKHAQKEGISVDGREESNPFVGVLRSKGFCWVAPQKWEGGSGDAWRHDTAMYWSHAGKHFGLLPAGAWWGTIPKDEMKDYFTDMSEYERIIREDFLTEEWSDRRQELVFIGTQIDEKEITDALDHCLCSDDEMDRYRQQQNYQMAMEDERSSLFSDGVDEFDPSWT